MSRIPFMYSDRQWPTVFSCGHRGYTLVKPLLAANLTISETTTLYDKRVKCSKCADPE